MGAEFTKMKLEWDSVSTIKGRVPLEVEIDKVTRHQTEVPEVKKGYMGGIPKQSGSSVPLATSVPIESDQCSCDFCASLSQKCL